MDGIEGMSDAPLDRRARLLRALARQPVDRPPVIFTGGSMSGVSAEELALSGFSLSEVRLQRGRVGIAVAAVQELARTAGDLPIIGNLIGPVSVAASAVRPDAFFRELRSRPDEVHALVEHVTEFEIAFARALVAAGA